MSFNSSRLPDSWCSFLLISNSSKSTSVYYQVTLSYSLCFHFAYGFDDSGGKCFDFGSDLEEPVSQDAVLCTSCRFVLHRLLQWVAKSTILCCVQISRISRKEKTDLHCWCCHSKCWILFSSLTVIVMTIIAVERWLHMSQRSLLTVRRVLILYTTSAVLLIVLDAVHMYGWYYTNRNFKTVIVIFVLCTALCFVLTAFAYYKVYRIIRHHQNQIQNNENTIDIEKYKKSVFTILYILALFLLSYVPYVCCLLVVNILDIFGTKSSSSAFNVCGAIVFFPRLRIPCSTIGR